MSRKLKESFLYWRKLQIGLIVMKTKGGDDIILVFVSFLFISFFDEAKANVSVVGRKTVDVSLPVNQNNVFFYIFGLPRRDPKIFRIPKGFQIFSEFSHF